MSEARPSITPRQAIASVLLVLLFLGAGVVGFGILKSLRGEPERSVRPPSSVVVRAIEPLQEAYREEISGYGRVRALRRSSVPAQLSARVVALDPGLEAGREVDSSTVLVHLDPTDYQTAVDSAEAQLRADQSRAKSSRIRHENLGQRVESMQQEVAAGERDQRATLDLQTQGLATQREVDVQRQAVERLRQRLSEIELQHEEAAEAILQADETVARSQKALERAQADRSRCEVRAPYAGVVVERQAQLGTWVTPGAALFEVVDPTRVELPISLAASRYGGVAVGARARLYDRRGGELLAEATVTRLDPVVDDERTFEVYVELGGEGQPPPLEPGRFVHAIVDGPQYEAVVVVPRVAFVGDGVFVAVDEDGQQVARRREPSVRRWLPEVALVDGGLEPTQPILVSNLEEVAEGTVVRLAEAPAEIRSEPRP